MRRGVDAPRQPRDDSDAVFREVVCELLGEIEPNRVGARAPTIATNGLASDAGSPRTPSSGAASGSAARRAGYAGAPNGSIRTPHARELRHTIRRANARRAPARAAHRRAPRARRRDRACGAAPRARRRVAVRHASATRATREARHARRALRRADRAAPRTPARRGRKRQRHRGAPGTGAALGNSEGAALSRARRLPMSRTILARCAWPAARSSSAAPFSMVRAVHCVASSASLCAAWKLVSRSPRGGTRSPRRNSRFTWVTSATDGPAAS